jgi:hypothetical protein
VISVSVETRVPKRLQIDCSICRTEPAVLRSVITNPLIDSVHTLVCLDCWAINDAATKAILAGDRRLVHTEVRV